MKLAPSGIMQVSHDDEDSEGTPDVVQDFSDSKNFYGGSIAFMNNRSAIRYAAGFTCSQCHLKSRHCSQSGYCYLHKRIIDMGETCPFNTRNTYENVNFPR